MEAQDRMLNDEETEMLPSSERDCEPTGISSDTAVSHTEEEQADTVPLLPSTTGTEDGTVLSTSSRSSQGTPNNAMVRSTPASVRSYDSLVYSITSEEASLYNRFRQQHARDRTGLPPQHPSRGNLPSYGAVVSDNVYRPRTMIEGLLQSQSRNGTQSVPPPRDSLDLPPNGGRNDRPELLPPAHSRSLYSCVTSPRVIFTICICCIVLGNLILGDGGRKMIEEWWEMGVRGMHGQHTASLVQAKLVPKVPKLDLKPLKLGKAKKNKLNKGGKEEKHHADDEVTGCEATIMLIRHCEKGKLRSHCSFVGYERAAYLSTLFGDDKRWPAPDQIYALSKGRTHKLNFREVETVQAISDTVHVPINSDYSTDDTKQLSKVLLEQLLEGELCGKLILVSWQHSDIPRLAQHLGCGPLQGCPWDYKGSVFDNTWQIRYVFTDFYDSKTGESKQKWNIFGSVQPENFDPLAFSKSVGDYPPGGTAQGSSLAQWGQKSNFVFYG